MGQKINPNSFRIGINQSWTSRWTHDLSYSEYFKEDLLIKNFISSLTLFQQIFLGQISIWRLSNPILKPKKLLGGQNDSVHLQTLEEYSYPLLNQKSNSLTTLYIYFQLYIPFKKENKNITQTKEDSFFHLYTKIESYLSRFWSHKYQIKLLIDPIFDTSSLKTLNIPRQNKDNSTIHSLSRTKNSSKGIMIDSNQMITKWLLEKDSQFLAQWIASEIRRRKGLKDILKKIERALKDVNENIQNKDSLYLIKGIKIMCSGRFLMTDNEKRRNKMARIKTFKRGQIPLQTLNQKINYSSATAYTVDGTSGIQLWISYI